MTTTPCDVTLQRLGWYIEFVLDQSEDHGPSGDLSWRLVPPLFPLPGQPALLHCLMSDPVRPTWWLVSQSEDRGPPGKSVMAPGLPPPASTWSALVHMKRFHPARPTWWLVSQSEDRGPPGKSVMAPGLPPSRLYLASLARFEFFQVYQVAWPTVKYGVPARLRARSWGGKRGGGERT